MSQGTWRYISALLLNYPLKGNDVSDDIEAFMHLLIIYGLQFHDHVDSTNPDGIRNALSIYDQCTYKGGYWVGARMKLRYVKEGTLPCELEPEAGKDGFRSLLEALAQACKTHYESLDWQDMERYAVPVSKKTNSTPSTPASNALPSMLRQLMAAHAVKPEVTAATGSQAPSSSSVKESTAKPSLLSTHDAFISIFTDALMNLDAWDPKDKREDQFKKIEWKLERSNSMSLNRKSLSTKRAIDAVYTPSPLSHQGSEQAEAAEESVRKRTKNDDAAAGPEK